MNKDLFLPADILLPKSDFEKWSVIACDQYTSEAQYWEKVAETVGKAPSALNIIFPEAYLEQDKTKKIAQINANMKSYLDGNIFNLYEDTYVYITRTLADGKKRHGILGLIDLEDYSFEKGSKALIRATEETVTERIPPRVEIRVDAPLELPHIMLLIDDPKETVIEPLEMLAVDGEVLYDFDLMQNSGHIKGIAVPKLAAENIRNSLAGLIENSEDKLLFAVGDGNHSLASAKECYKINKTESSRYALVEVVNIHEASLEFEPIYRLVFGVEPEKLIMEFIDTLGGEYQGADAQKFICIYGDKTTQISVKPTAKLAVGTLQSFLDNYLKSNTNATIDYIHGENSVKALAGKPNAIGFLFEGMQKRELFDAIKQDGSLPRKTFSMGHADDKRFYLEARKIK